MRQRIPVRKRFIIGVRIYSDMSNPSKYSGLAGTILLGTLLGLNYTQYARRKSPLGDKGAAFDPDDEAVNGQFYDKDGHIVPLGKTNLPGIEAVRRIRDVIPDISPLVLCAAISGLWAIRSFGAMNRVLIRRYSDVVYQIRRPDVIANRLTAWKYLGVGGALIPASAIGYGYYLRSTGGLKATPHDALRTALSGIAGDSQRVGSLSCLRVERSQLTASVAEFSRTLRDGFRP